MKTKLPLILAIDTSCDDTSVAVTSGLTVLSNIISGQTQLHAEYGGVFPTVAKQAHKENIQPAIKLALKRAHLSIDSTSSLQASSRTAWDQIDAIAVTQGPGLAPALEIGINKAKELAKKHNKKLIAVNHLEGHLLSVLAKRKRVVAPTVVEEPFDYDRGDIKFPMLGLIISGGNSLFVLVKDIGDYQVIGETIDDAAGEALDKIGRMLGLGYPAGPIIEKFAKLGDKHKFKFPLPMTTSGDFNLSFSGLKTFARNKLEELEAKNQLDKQAIYDFAASSQYAIFRHICYKLGKILKKYPSLGQIWLGGGVAANIELRVMIRETIRPFDDAQGDTLKLITPYSKKLCSDNAAMIGVAAYFKYQNKNFVENLSELERKPRWKI